MLLQNTPAGTTVGEIRAGFPSRIVITDLAIPIPVSGRSRQLVIRKISGSVSILSLLSGRIDSEMNSDLFGGTLWVNAGTESWRRAAADRPSRVVLEARGRTLDVGRLCEFFGSPVTANGFVDADIEAEASEPKPALLNGRALLMGKGINIPIIRTKKVILPENRNVEIIAKLSANNGNIVIDEFQFRGAAYDVSGNGVIKLAEPLETSPLEGSCSLVFYENFTITDERFAGAVAHEIAAAFVASRGKVIFRLTGTVGKPEARLDSISSLGDSLRKLRH
jgi:type II secretion system protein N